MKREAETSDNPYSKRPRHDRHVDPQPYGRGGRQLDHPSNLKNNQSRQSRQDGRSRNTARQNGSRDTRDHMESASLFSSPSQDPAVSLESLLKSLTAQPDAVRQVLGESALENAAQLLQSLGSRDKSPKTTLHLFHPETVPHSPLHDYTIAQPLHSSSLPPLPPLPEGPYARATFTHKSVTAHDRVSGHGDLTYEKLEFLGDAYIEIIATRIIFARFPHLAAGPQAQVRERMVKNDTLSQFSIAYGFRERLQASEIEQKGKAVQKILADVFEAYVAAIILSDPVDGFKRAEEWLTNLWTPILLQELGPNASHNQGGVGEYNANAKQELQQKIWHNDVKLEYLEHRPMEQLKHVQRYSIDLYLTGYGHEKKKIGYGEGRNKVEAGNRAAMQAMHLNSAIVDDAAAQLAASKEQKKLERLEPREAEWNDGWRKLEAQNPRLSEA